MDGFHMEAFTVMLAYIIETEIIAVLLPSYKRWIGLCICPETNKNHVCLQALDNVPVLLYILALKTLLLCLAFAGVKIYQSNKEQEALKKKQEEKRKLAQQTQKLVDNLKEDWVEVLRLRSHSKP